MRNKTIRDYQVKGTPFYVYKDYQLEYPLWVIYCDNYDLLNEIIGDEDQCWYYKAEAMEIAKNWWEKNKKS